ncbi:MAG: cupin domain-containing protein [Candidatus Hodarchaeota archaeon]
MNRSSYPEIIKSLPKIKTNLEGVTGWLAQGESFQIVFFEIEAGRSVPPHSHGPQFGFIIEGSVTLTIGDTPHELAGGDSYYIPSQVSHHGTFHSFTLAVDFFTEPNRYEAV